MASGMSRQEILDDYPDLVAEDVEACLLWAARLAQVKSVRIFAA